MTVHCCSAIEATKEPRQYLTPVARHAISVLKYNVTWLTQNVAHDLFTIFSGCEFSCNLSQVVNGITVYWYLAFDRHKNGCVC